MMLLLASAKKYYCLAVMVIIGFSPLFGQDFVANYDEDKVPEFSITDPLVFANGKEVKSIEEWEGIRREEILELFSREMYGDVPDKDVEVNFKIKSVEHGVLGGKASRKLVNILVGNGPEPLVIEMLIYLPSDIQGKVPLFLGLNFYGNHTITNDPGVPLAKSWVRNNTDFGIKANQATEASRGARTNRWDIEKILENGYGLANIYYGDIDPDFDDGFQNGIHPFFNQKDQKKPKANEWGSIAAWSWGLSRALDYIEYDADIDEKKVAVFGHSRLGKTSIWAGVKDERFALVISNNSGCGGAALSKRAFGETVGRINSSFPHWFNDNFLKYNENEGELPFDQHMLISLIAPRPVYIASAKEDQWADPRGEFLSGYYASKVYNLYGYEGLPNSDLPNLNQPIQEGNIGYHIRSGKHDVTPYDWEQYIKFADQFLK